jgi:hypothetical protein
MRTPLSILESVGMTKRNATRVIAPRTQINWTLSYRKRNFGGFGYSIERISYPRSVEKAVRTTRAVAGECACTTTVPLNNVFFFGSSKDCSFYYSLSRKKSLFLSKGVLNTETDSPVRQLSLISAEPLSKRQSHGMCKLSSKIKMSPGTSSEFFSV